MIELVERHRGEIEALCRRYRVKRLEVFGSAADGTFDPARSDLDFLVEFQPMEPGSHAKAYFGVWFGLQDLFQRPVDMVETPAITNPYFLRAIGPQRTTVYAP
jgi:predicted nucleotidyltransferase